jgi:hypothetical protein
MQHHEIIQAEHNRSKVIYLGAFLCLEVNLFRSKSFFDMFLIVQNWIDAVEGRLRLI